MRLRFAIFFAALLATNLAAADEKVVVGGSGSLTDEMVEMSKAFMAKNPGETVEVRPESMSTTGGIEGVQTGRFAIGLVARRLQDSEKNKFVYRAIARSMTGVVIHKSLLISSLSDAQICDIFSGKTKSWKEVGGSDLKITVLTRKRDDNNTDNFRKHMDCFKDLKVSPEAISLLRGSELLDALDKRPGTIGITNLGSNFSEHQNIKALAIGGVAASPEAVRSDKYKFYHEHGAITLGEPQGLTKRFLEFINTGEGQKIIASRGALGLR
ncbi:MAG TPA: substrate-binding domain-containing protein [Candidatus Binatus sp.]|nr:substrate-binding domain-containing protein [Candidatus Binatus sp.]